MGETHPHQNGANHHRGLVVSIKESVIFSNLDNFSDFVKFVIHVDGLVWNVKVEASHYFIELFLLLESLFSISLSDRFNRLLV